MGFQTKVFDRYSRVERALINAIIESYLQGVSTRLGIEDLSASSVSRIAKELDERVEEFLKRPIHLWSDGEYIGTVSDNVTSDAIRKYIEEQPKKNIKASLNSR
jgi:transposase-like protein